MGELQEVTLVDLTSETDPIPDIVDLTLQDKNMDNCGDERQIVDGECQIIDERRIICEIVDLEPIPDCSIIWEEGTSPRVRMGEEENDDVEVIFDAGAIDLAESVQRTNVLGSYGSEEEDVDIEAVDDEVDAAEEIPDCEKTTEPAGLSPISQRLDDFVLEEHELGEQLREDYDDESGNEPDRCEDEPQLQEEDRSSPLLEESREDPQEELESSSSAASTTWNSKCKWDSPEAVADFARKFYEAYNHVVVNSSS